MLHTPKPDSWYSAKAIHAAQKYLLCALPCHTEQRSLLWNYTIQWYWTSYITIIRRRGMFPHGLSYIIFNYTKAAPQNWSNQVSESNWTNHSHICRTHVSESGVKKPNTVTPVKCISDLCVIRYDRSHRVKLHVTVAQVLTGGCVLVSAVRGLAWPHCCPFPVWQDFDIPERRHT